MEPAEARLRAAEHIAKVGHDPDGAGADTVITGLLNLNMMVLFMLVNEQGAMAENILERAAAVLRELSRQLPE
jgi:hypothetical protein